MLFRSLAEASRNARTISGAYCFQALGILINMATAWAGSSEIQTMQGTGINNLAYVTVIMVALIASISYVGLSIERANTAELVLAQHALRVAQWQGKHQTITRSDRTKLLSMLSASVSQAMLQPLTAAYLNLQMVQRALSQDLHDKEQPRQMLDKVVANIDRKSTRLNSSHSQQSRMPSSA